MRTRSSDSLFSLLVFLAAMLGTMASNSFAQAVTLQGFVRTMTGVPIVGATVRLVTLNLTTQTDANGHYDFANPLALDPFSGTEDFSLQSQGHTLFLNLDRRKKVTLEIFDFTGKSLTVLRDEILPPGPHAMTFPIFGASQRLLLLKIQVGSDLSWRKLSMDGSQGSMSTVSVPAGNPALLAKFAAADSVNVSHPNYHGGLYNRHGRRVTATTGIQNFRMFSTDAGWNVCAPPINFIFTPNATGVSYYQQTIPTYVATEQEVLREVCQSIWRLPSEVPTNRRFTSYTANVNGNVTTGVASTGGNTLNFNPAYINGQPWYELVGVQVHEAVHSYQPYYAATGADGFGESVPDAIRAITGFFTWRTAGNRCSGSYADAYQTGARYWYYIEMKYPGFIYNVYKVTSGDISARVQQVTGQSLSTLVTECQNTGMPPGSG